MRPYFAFALIFVRLSKVQGFLHCIKLHISEELHCTLAIIQTGDKDPHQIFILFLNPSEGTVASTKPFSPSPSFKLLGFFTSSFAQTRGCTGSSKHSFYFFPFLRTEGWSQSRQKLKQPWRYFNPENQAQTLQEVCHLL